MRVTTRNVTAPSPSRPAISLVKPHILGELAAAEVAERDRTKSLEFGGNAIEEADEADNRPSRIRQYIFLRFSSLSSERALSSRSSNSGLFQRHSFHSASDLKASVSMMSAVGR